jgi:ATP-binding cassette subfamily F protein 3
MIMINKLSLRLGESMLFDGISFTINENDKIGLTGRNGAGKSTLLRVIKGIQQADEYDVSMPKNTTIGYLPQELHVDSDKTVYDETRTAFSDILKIENELALLQHEMETRTDYESSEYMNLINRYHEQETLLNNLGGYHKDEEIEKILKGLGFTPDDFDKPLKHFSGGWQMRVELAKMLLQKPDLILLDEPTNHLDIESVTWLETFLKTYTGAIMLVSHDRAFLDNVTSRTIEISRGKIEDYKVPYSKYLLLRAERREQQLAARKNQEREISQMQRNIDRFRAKASKASFAQSLIKKLEKIEIIEIEEEDTSAMKIRFPKAPQSGRMVVSGKQITKRFGLNKSVISNLNFEIERGDKIAFVGKNGMGKTTLTRIIAGNLDYEGTLKYGHNVLMGYYAQHQTEMLHPDYTVLEEIEQAAPAGYEGNLRTLLGAFLFSGDDVYKKVKVLSGGEKSRLAIAKLLLQPLNFLILDEPTNHLDMIAKDVLKKAMQHFEGTIIVVSHDREFLQGLTHKVFEFTSDGIKEHLGDIYEFLEKKKADSFRAIELQKDIINQLHSNTNKKPLNKNQNERKEQEKELKRIKNSVIKLEAQIACIEKQIAEIEAKLKNPADCSDLYRDDTFFSNYELLKQQLQTALQQWEQLSIQLEYLNER